MRRSPFRKADGQSHSDYGRTVALKLAAFALAIALFFPISSFLARPKAMKDLSNGTLPFTFATRDKALQRELASLNAARALPNQRNEGRSVQAKRLALALCEALSGSEFQRLKDACERFEAASDEEAGEQGRKSLQEDFLSKLEFAKRDDGSFLAAFESKALLAQLQQILSVMEASAEPLPLQEVSDGQANSLLPALQRVLDAKAALSLAAGERQQALKAFDLSLKLANSSMNSQEPDVHYLRKALSSMAASLQSRRWSLESLRDLQAMTQRQRARPNPRKALLAFETEKALFSFEKVRQTGLRSLSGAAPGVNILADSIREMRPNGAAKAAKEAWDGMRYDVDADELEALRTLAKLNGPGVTPFFKAAQTANPQNGDGPVSARLKASLLTELRKQSECVALMEAMDLLLKSRLGMELSNEKASPVDGLPYRLLKAPGKTKAVFGDASGDFVALYEGNESRF